MKKELFICLVTLYRFASALQLSRLRLAFLTEVYAHRCKTAFEQTNKT